MVKVIRAFNGPNRFLSNFYPSEISMDDEVYPTVEHAYQALKYDDPIHRATIRNMSSAASAKKAGTRATLPENWTDIRSEHMLSLVRAKFSIPELRQMLIDTGDAYLIEGNDRGDHFWGECRGEGLNILGKILMRVRQEINAEIQYKQRKAS